MPKHTKKRLNRSASEIVRLSLSEDIAAASIVAKETRSSLFGSLRNRLWFAGAGLLLLLLGLGVMANNGLLPHTDGMTGKKTGWFGRELPKNAASSWNPLAPPLPTATP